MISNGYSKKAAIGMVSKIAISILLIVALFQMVDIDEYIEVFSLVSIIPLLFSIGILVLCVFVNALKWKVLLNEVSLTKLVYICFRAQFFSTILPGQIFGETSKLLLSKEYDKNKAAASVIYDKYTGFLSQIFVAIVGLLFSGELAKWAVLVFVLLIFFSLILSISRISFIDGLMERAISHSKVRKWRIALSIYEILSAWRYFSRDNGILFHSVFWGLINQALGVCVCCIISHSIGARISCWNYCWVLTMVNMLLIIPISYAGIGVREISFVSLLTGLGATNSQSIIISTIFLIAQLVEAIIGGICILIKSLLSFGR